MFVIFMGEAGVDYAVGVVLVINHDVLISAASMDREAASFVSVQFSDVSFPNMKLFG